MAKSSTIPAELSQKLIEVNEWLFYGDKKEVAKRAHKSYNYTCQVLDGARMCKEVIVCAIEVSNENKARFEITPKMQVA